MSDENAPVILDRLDIYQVVLHIKSTYYLSHKTTALKSGFPFFRTWTNLWITTTSTPATTRTWSESSSEGSLRLKSIARCVHYSVPIYLWKHGKRVPHSQLWVLAYFWPSFHHGKHMGSEGHSWFFELEFFPMVKKISLPKIFFAGRGQEGGWFIAVTHGPLIFDCRSFSRSCCPDLVVSSWIVGTERERITMRSFSLTEKPCAQKYSSR